MKFIDSFLFLNELDLLEIRLNELYNVIDVFIIVESNITLSGRKKDFILEANMHRFDRFKDKIIYSKVDGMNLFPKFNTLSYDDRHKLVFLQRDEIYSLLMSCGFEDEDIVMFSDLDEIPRESIIMEIKNNPHTVNTNAFTTLSLRGHYWYLNTTIDSPGDHTWFPTPIVGKLSNFKTTNLTDLRQRKDSFPRIDNAGWHFSHCGSPSHLREKMLASSHSEFHGEEYTSVESIERRRGNLEDPYGRGGFSINLRDFDDFYPKWAVDNKHLFKDLIRER